MGDQTQAYDIFQTPLSSGYPLPLKAYSRESTFFHIKSKYLCFISRFYYAIVAAYLNCTITFLVEHVASFPKSSSKARSPLNGDDESECRRWLINN